MVRSHPSVPSAGPHWTYSSGWPPVTVPDGIGGYPGTSAAQSCQSSGHNVWQELHGIVSQSLIFLYLSSAFDKYTLHGATWNNIQKLQLAQKAAAPIVLGVPKVALVKPLLHELW